MTQYGPPHRFQAVDTETGEIKPFDLKHLFMPSKRTAVYQSTGHTTNGQELFFGDVVLIDGEMREVQWDSKSFAIVTVRFGGYSAPFEWMLPDAILGNVHTPQDVLKQRAEELKDART